MENYWYKMATGIGLGTDVPTQTPDSMEWDSLIQDQSKGDLSLRNEATYHSE